jgi:hypothetical protein
VPLSVSFSCSAATLSSSFGRYSHKSTVSPHSLCDTVLGTRKEDAVSSTAGDPMWFQCDKPTHWESHGDPQTVRRSPPSLCGSLPLQIIAWFAGILQIP